MAYLNALVVVGAIVLSVMLIILLIVKSSHQAQPQPETDLELGALPAATILVTSNSHSVWTKQEVTTVSQSQVSVNTRSHSSSQSSGGDVFQAERGTAEDSAQRLLQSPTVTGIAVIPSSGTLQCSVFEETSLSRKEESAASVLTQVPSQEKSSGGDAFPGEVGTSEEDFDECPPRSPKGAGLAVIPTNLQSSTLEEEATESSPSVDKSAASVLTQVPNQEKSSGGDAFPGEVGTSEEDFDECPPRSPKGAGLAVIPTNLQSSTLEEEATESSPSVDKSAASVLTQVPNDTKPSGGEAIAKRSSEEASKAVSDEHAEGEAVQSSVSPEAEKADEAPGGKVVRMEQSSSEESGDRVASEDEEGAGGLQCSDPYEEGKAKIALANCDKILENLYLGGVEAVSDHSKLTSQGVRAICVCCREFEIPSKSFATGIDYYRVDVEDMSKEPLEEFLEEATDFIYSWTSQNLPVLVHCRAGVSRSASVVLAYMVRFANFTLNDAFVYLRAARPAVTPNLGFMEKLVAYEEETNDTEGTIDTRKYESWFTFQASSPVAIPDLKPDEA
ncbi:unnamed protein product [Cladocopium goreaui]|uniref:Protein-tyrosine-phosphatase n=1 Tax=Cladocopium goreaui TaxID=2562237 RepID=A0A9P1GK10_9DINO|nr:unnamed protein product [Cladocopium goreaui]